MRRCLIGDLLAAADCVVGMAGEDQSRHLARLLAEAHAAHRYARRFGRPHPRWGDGSLMARALAERPTPEPRPCLDLAALAAVATGLLQFQQDRRVARTLVGPQDAC